MSTMRKFQMLCDTPECHETVPRTGQCGYCRRDAEEAREANLGEILDNHVWQNYQAVSPSGTTLSVEAHEHVSRYNKTRAKARRMEPQPEEPLTAPSPTMTRNDARPLAPYIQAAKERRELIDEVLARHEEVA